MQNKNDYLTIAEPSTKIVLAGSKEEIENFATLCTPDGSTDAEIKSLNNKRWVMDCFYYNKILNNKIYELWFLDLERLSDNDYIEANIHKATAIIYLNPDVEQSARVESFRDEQSCIAIDFNCINLEPLACLEKISNLYLIHYHFIDLYNEVKDTAFQMWKSRYDFKSTFFHLPHDISNYIAQLMLKNCNLFSSSSKPIYIAFPPENVVNEILVKIYAENSNAEKSESICITM